MNSILLQRQLHHWKMKNPCQHNMKILVNIVIRVKDSFHQNCSFGLTCSSNYLFSLGY